MPKPTVNMKPREFSLRQSLSQLLNLAPEHIGVTGGENMALVAIAGVTPAVAAKIIAFVHEHYGCLCSVIGATEIGVFAEQDKQDDDTKKVH